MASCSVPGMPSLDSGRIVRPIDRQGRGGERSLSPAGAQCSAVVLPATTLPTSRRICGGPIRGVRRRLPADTSVGAEFLPGVVVPTLYGSTHDGGVFWASGQNWVETQSYAGVTVIVALWISYVGGPLTEVVNSFPLVRYSSVGRARVVANLALAVLAGLGIEAWLRGRMHHRDVDLVQGIRRAVLASLAGGVVCAPFVLSWLRITREAGAVKETAVGMLVPLALGCAAAATLWFVLRRRLPDGVAVSLVTLLVAVELLVGLGSMATIVRKESVDLRTSAHEVAIETLRPGERMNAEGRVFLANAGQTVGLDDVRTNGFLPPGWREVFKAVDDDHFLPPGTVANPYFSDVHTRSEALARLGVGLCSVRPASMTTSGRSISWSTVSCSIRAARSRHALRSEPIRSRDRYRWFAPKGKTSPSAPSPAEMVGLSSMVATSSCTTGSRMSGCVWPTPRERSSGQRWQTTLPAAMLRSSSRGLLRGLRCPLLSPMASTHRHSCCAPTETRPSSTSTRRIRLWSFCRIPTTRDGR